MAEINIGSIKGKLKTETKVELPPEGAAKEDIMVTTEENPILPSTTLTKYNGTDTSDAPKKRINTNKPAEEVNKAITKL